MSADERLSSPGADMAPVGRVLRIPTLESMRYRDYRLLWMLSTLVTSSSYFKTVVIGWLTYDVTGSALLTALAIGIESLPNLLASPIGGVLADRVDRRKLVATTAVYNVVLTFGMSAVLLLNRAEPWPILAYMLLFGIGHTMGQPAKTSYGAYIVPEKALLNAFSLLSVAYNTAALIGPAIAGVMLAVYGPGRTLWAGAGLILLSGVVIQFLKPVGAEMPVRPRTSFVSQLADGAAAMAQEPMVVGLFLTQVVVYGVLSPSVYALLPVYAADVFGVGPQGLGILTSSMGVGAILGVLTMTTLSSKVSRGWAALVVMSIAALAMIGLSQTGSFAAAIALLIVYNTCVVSLTAIKSSGIQSLVPAHLRGRVAALTTMSNGLFPVGTIVFGAIAQWRDVSTATIAGAGILSYRSCGYTSATRNSASSDSSHKTFVWRSTIICSRQSTTSQPTLAQSG